MYTPNNTKKLILLIYITLIINLITITSGLPNQNQINQNEKDINKEQKVLDMTSAPILKQRDQYSRSVNLSFFVPAFSLFALASQFMPQMFPGLTTTTSSRNQRQRRELIQQEQEQEQNWIENFITNGLIY